MMMKLRPEAGPRGTLKELTKHQKDGFVNLVQLLCDATGYGETGDSERGERESQTSKRKSQIFFISGSRGAGKTTLLLSLTEAVKRGTIPGVDEDRRDEREEQLRHLKGRLVWLDTIDLDPMPKEANLLLSVLARVQEKFEEAFGGASRMCGALLDSPNDADRLESSLRDLQHSVTAAWDMDVLKMSQSLEMRSYAAAASEAEHARLKLNKRLEEVLRGIAKALPSEGNGKGKDRVFVLPVDDFDLDPLRSIELLRLIRMLSVPNLVAIFLGDLDLAQEIQYYDCYGQIAARLGQGASSGLLSRIYPRASELASSMLRKLIPPSHRIYLAPLSHEDVGQLDVWPGQKLETCLRGIEIEGVMIKEVVLSEDSKEKSKPIDLLRTLEESSREKENPSQKGSQPKPASRPAQTTSSPHSEAISLWGILHGKVLPGWGSSWAGAVKDAKDAGDFVYQPREMLDATPRHLVDLALSFQGPRSSDESDKLDEIIQQLVHLLHLELQEDPRVSFELAVTITGAFWRRNGRFVMDASSFLREKKLSQSADFDLNDGDQNVLNARACLEKRIWVRPDESNRAGPTDGAVRLGSRAAAYVMLIHDLLYLNDRDRILGKVDAMKEPNEEPLAQVHQGVTKLTSWPHPFDGTFVEFQAFNKVWENGLRKCRHALREASLLVSDDLAKRLVAIWIHAGLFALGVNVKDLWGDHEFGLHKEESGQWKAVKGEDIPWAELGKRVQKVLCECAQMRLKNQDDQRAELLERWLGDLLLLFGNRIPPALWTHSGNGKKARKRTEEAWRELFSTVLLKLKPFETQETAESILKRVKTKVEQAGAKGVEKYAWFTFHAEVPSVESTKTSTMRPPPPISAPPKSKS